jgi:hypothetical protein
MSVHPILRLALRCVEPTMRTDSRTVLAEDLQPGDFLEWTIVGDNSGRIHSVQVDPRGVLITLEEPGRSVYLWRRDICSVRRKETR